MRDVEDMAAAVFGDQPEVLLATRQHDRRPHLVAIVPDRSSVSVTRALARLYAAGDLAVVSTALGPFATPAEMHAGYQRLLPCLGLLAWEPPRLLRRAAVAVYLPLRGDMRALAECVHDVLGPVLEADAADALVETLATYYGPAGCSKARTAALLRVQARTVFNRLQRIKQLTGLDPTANALPLALATHLVEPYRRWQAMGGSSHGEVLDEHRRLPDGSRAAHLPALAGDRVGC
jgi:hypothetical protein